MKKIAQQWVIGHVADLTGFVGAYLTGSTIWKSDLDSQAESSDVDIFIVIQSADLPPKLGKIYHLNLILEINYVDLAAISDVDAVLSNYHLASAFYKDSILLDPYGKLAPLHEQVKAQYANHHYVTKRCLDAKNNALNWLQTFNTASELHDQVTSLFFAAGVTTHMLLVAGLQNPTIRRRYVESSHLLTRHNLTDFHEKLLTTLGSHTMSAQAVNHHLDRLDRHFTTACQVMASPYMFAADMQLELKPIAIGGVKEMIDDGYPREAVFWLIAIFCRSRAVICADGSADQLFAIDADLWGLLDDLGIQNHANMQLRAATIRDDIASTWQIANQIIDQINL